MCTNLSTKKHNCKCLNLRTKTQPSNILFHIAFRKKIPPTIESQTQPQKEAANLPHIAQSEAEPETQLIKNQICQRQRPAPFYCGAEPAGYIKNIIKKQCKQVMAYLSSSLRAEYQPAGGPRSLARSAQLTRGSAWLARSARLGSRGFV